MSYHDEKSKKSSVARSILVNRGINRRHWNVLEEKKSITTRRELNKRRCLLI